MTQRRGYMLMQMMLVLGITSLALWLGTALMIRLWRLNAQAAERHATALRYEQMIHRLRADIASADAVTVSNPGEVVIGTAHWRARDKQLQRIEGTDTRTWDMPGPATFSVAPAGVVLELEDGSARPARLPIINPVLWAREVAK